MDATITVFTLLHVLMFVYWLGGDLGAFYSSSFLTDPKRSVAERTMALKILNNIDMAPRTALILALPTGVTLAWSKGWLDVPVYVPLTIDLLALAWLALAWAVHLRHDGGMGMKRVDIVIRWAVMTGMLGVGIAGATHAIELPLFIALKLVVLAGCIGLGLALRKLLGPLFAPIREMMSSGPTAQTDAAIAGVLSRTRPVVVMLWMLLLVAAWLGIATPT